MYFDLLLIVFDVFFQISFGVVGGIKGDFQFVNVLFQFFFDFYGFSFIFGFSFQISLYGIKGMLVVVFGVVEFFFFFFGDVC